jgi:hypothetical protein
MSHDVIDEHRTYCQGRLSPSTNYTHGSDRDASPQESDARPRICYGTQLHCLGK